MLDSFHDLVLRGFFKAKVVIQPINQRILTSMLENVVSSEPLGCCSLKLAFVEESKSFLRDDLLTLVLAEAASKLLSL